MTRDEFTAAAIALLRSAVGWQSAIARRLGVDPRTVRRWLAAGETPGWADEKLAGMMGGLDAGPWPRDEWVVGDGLAAFGPDDAARRREYIVHLAPPRFAARIVIRDSDGLPMEEEWPADVLSGVTYAALGAVADGDEELVLCEIDWIDTPNPGEVTQLLEAAADAVEREYDLRSDLE